MPVSRELNCIFVHVPRTGGTSMEVALGMNLPDRPETMFGRVTSSVLRGRKFSSHYLQHLTAPELRDVLGDEFDSCFRFAFIRNPWERMVSSYCYYRRANGEVLSFRDYLKYADGKPREHVTPQSKFIFDRDGKCLVDFVGRFERLQDDFAEVCGRLKVERTLPHTMAATIGDYKSYYDATSRKDVERRFGEDIERFGYSF
jgi:chondroitin 4-sulfotransferase 11